jgi:hypothetical protein
MSTPFAPLEEWKAALLALGDFDPKGAKTPNMKAALARYGAAWDRLSFLERDKAAKMITNAVGFEPFT